MVPESPAPAAIAGGTWPRVMHSSARSDGAAAVISRHRVNKHVVGKTHKEYHVAFLPKADMRRYNGGALTGNKFHCHTINAIAQIGRRGSIGKNVPKMTATTATCTSIENLRTPDPF